MITLKVTPDEGEPYEVTASSRVIYQWERTHRNRSFNDLAEPRMDVLYELAHFTAQRFGRFDGTLGDFIAACDIQPIKGEEPDPTQSAP